jgi:DNA-binding MltR family transcriptional regulator
MRVDFLNEIGERLRKESDRAIAIVAASILEVQLERLISKAMIAHKEVPELFKGFGPLSSMSAKSSLALFLGLLPTDIYNDLTYIRKIRNEFAHNYKSISFSDSPVSDFIGNLISVRWFLHCMPLADKPITKQEEEEFRTQPRRKFELAVSIVGYYLDEYIEATNKMERRKEEFPMPKLS